MSREASAGSSFEQLLKRARASDRGALEELFRRYQPHLDAWASNSLTKPLPGARPSDITQETALHAFRQFSAFKGTTEGEWIAWLHTIFRSRTAQSYRDARRKKRDERTVVSTEKSPEAMEVPASQKSPSQFVTHEEEWRRMLAQLYQLPDDQRDAIWYCRMKEIPVADVAQRMQKTEAAVAGLIQRGLKTLQSRMKGDSAAQPAEPTAAEVALNDAAAALLTYLRRRDAGQDVDPESFVAEYPACADELRSMFAWMERLQALRPSAPEL